LAVISADLADRGRNHVVPLGDDLPIGFEDIARDPTTGHLFLVIEARKHGDDVQAWVAEFDADLHRIGDGWLEVSLPSQNKGIEGLTCAERDGVGYLLGMPEGNRGRAGAEGKRPGGGRVYVFRRHRSDWRRVDTIRLPESVQFVDYASLSVHREAITVVSQESSAVWVGRLRPDRWEVVDDGTVYLFPRAANGSPLYRSMEGISWLGPRRIATVSDRLPDRPDPRQRMVHIFDLPGH
jgi:hypothetical protein